MREKDKERVVVEVVQRVFERCSRDPSTLERALFDTFYEEGRRLETERDRPKARRQAARYQKAYHEAAHASPERQRELLKQIIQHFTEEVAGHFDPRIYALSTRVAPPRSPCCSTP